MLLYTAFSINFPSIMEALSQSPIFCLQDAYLASLIYMRNVYPILSVKPNFTILIRYHESKIKGRDITNNYDIK